MDPERRREAQARGGARGGHRFTKEEARAAGSKGGKGKAAAGVKPARKMQKGAEAQENGRRGGLRKANMRGMREEAGDGD
jgi:hypothetical protein